MRASNARLVLLLSAAPSMRQSWAQEPAGPSRVIQVCLYRNGLAAAPDATFRSGDRIAFDVIGAPDGHLTLLHHGADGALTRLYPPDRPGVPTVSGEAVLLPSLDFPMVVALTPPAEPERFLIAWRSEPDVEAEAATAPCVSPLMDVGRAAQVWPMASGSAKPAKAATRVQLGAETIEMTGARPPCPVYAAPAASAWSICLSVDHR